jgi:imidazolonepropionase-like amidohydrolase
MADPRQCIRAVRGAAILLLFASIVSAADSGDDLRAAARKGQDQQVASLLSHGMAVDSADRDGRTALMLAAQRGHATTVKLLLDRGAKPNLLDKQGFTAYALALLAGRDDVVKVFPHRDPIRVQLELTTASDNVYSSCSMNPKQLADQIAALQLDVVATAALREFAAVNGKGVVAFVDSEPQLRVALKLRPSVSCLQQQSTDNLSLAIDAKVVRVADGASLLEKTYGGGLKGLHARSATSPVQYGAVFDEFAKAHASSIYWGTVEAWLRAR